MATIAFDVEAVRTRFSALQTPFAFFDAPGGTQVPDSVIDAIATYLRGSNANVGGPYGTSIRTEALIDQAHLTAARFLNCDPAGIAFGPNMSTLNFALTRTAARELRRGDEVVVTRLDHDANVSPWLEVAHDLGVVIRFADIREDTSVDLDDLTRLLGPRTKVVAFPVAANSVGTLTDVHRIVELAHEPARWPGRTPCTTRHTARSTSRAGGSTCSSARRTSSSGRTWERRSPGRS
jgi:selenocysteine lyase/cysteine desulfurase